MSTSNLVALLSRVLLPASLSLFPVVSPVHAAEPSAPLEYAEVLRHLTDLDRLTRVQTGCKGGLFSSWDRNGTNAWGANGDAGHYLRIEPNGEAVMMDLDGPGVIYRIWSANPVGKIRFYLDEAQTPTCEWGFPDLFDGRLQPFIKPLVYRRDSPQSASDAYLPIPFAKHIKITADKAHGQYYHFNYVQFPKNRPVASFHLPLTPKDQAALAAVADVWLNPGRDPKPRLAGQTTLARKITVAPGGKVSLCEVTGPGVIRAVRARVDSGQRYAWRKLVLEGRWDGAVWPQVLTPLGPFFGFDFETADYGSVVAGCRHGQAYQFFPMPFGKSAELLLRNFLEVPATVDVEIEWAPLVRFPEDSAYFFARWRHEPDARTFDYPFVETAGRGHFVGVSMPIEHPLAGWWGEGDEKVWCDEDGYPPYVGTGSEDYFGDAWGIRYLSGPSFGASSAKGFRTCNYRWHFTDLIPFEKRMRMTIENYGPNGHGPRGQYGYTSTAFWYQAECTPPFAELKGVSYVGGDSPAGRPTKKEYEGDIFPEITIEKLRTYGVGATFAQQAEILLASVVAEGKAKRVSDARRSYEFDREVAVDFGRVNKDQKLGAVTLATEERGVYFVRVYTAPEADVAELSLEHDGKVLPVDGRPRPGVLQLGGLFLPEGSHEMTLVASSAGRAIADCLQLEPATRVAGALEAEELRLVKTTGDASRPIASEPLSSVSAGRLLQFRPVKAGQGLVLDLGERPVLPHVLAMRPFLGPSGAVIQAFASGRPIGPHFDLYSPERQLASITLPLGAVPAGAREVEIKVVDQNEKSGGFEVDMDYFRWDPEILGPGTAEGVWARVAGTRGCEYRAQDLGPSYSGGHQFWVQPSSEGAWVDIALELPQPGTYEVIVRYTKSWDYARIQAFLDGKQIGPIVDTYSETVVQEQPISLGKFALGAGRHVLRFQAVGKSEKSQGYLMGIDHVVVR